MQERDTQIRETVKRETKKRRVKQHPTKSSEDLGLNTPWKEIEFQDVDDVDLLKMIRELKENNERLADNEVSALSKLE